MGRGTPSSTRLASVWESSTTGKGRASTSGMALSGESSARGTARSSPTLPMRVRTRPERKALVLSRSPRSRAKART
jgi:hypothetical protein